MFRIGPLNIVSVLLCGVVLFFGNVSIHAQTSYNDTSTTPIYLSELNYAGSYDTNCRSCAYDKWIEIFNPNTTQINLSGYQLQFKQSEAANMNISLDGYTIPAQSYFLVSNKRAGMYSQLTVSGVRPDLISGKVLSMSNNINKTIDIQLLKDSVVIDSAQINSTQLVGMESQMFGKKHSLQRSGQLWIVSNSLYSPNNYGSPKGAIFTPPPVTQATIVPEPQLDEQHVTTQAISEPATIPAQATPALQPIAQSLSNAQISNELKDRVITNSLETQGFYIQDVPTTIPELNSITQSGFHPSYIQRHHIKLLNFQDQFILLSILALSFGSKRFLHFTDMYRNKFFNEFVELLDKSYSRSYI